MSHKLTNFAEASFLKLVNIMAFYWDDARCFFSSFLMIYQYLFFPVIEIPIEIFVLYISTHITRSK